MDDRLHILLCGRDSAGLEPIARILAHNPRAEVVLRILMDGEYNPLVPGGVLPDALVFNLSSDWREELKALTERPAQERIPSLIIGAEDDPQMMRMAMQGGARDFFTLAEIQHELSPAVKKLVREKEAHRDKISPITAVINAKGGSGASVVAANIAHILTLEGGLHTVLLDVDLQFGALPEYFDLEANNGLVQAIDTLETLDGMALEGYALKHKSGLHLLGTAQDSLILPGAEEIPRADSRLALLLDLLIQRYDQVVVDLPRQIDPFTTVILQRAEQVLVVLQQTLAHLRDAQRLLMFMRELAIQPGRIKIIVNRYDKNIPVTLADIEKSLNHKCFAQLPNDFQRTSESVNLGVPLYESNPKAKITRELRAVAEKVSARPFVEHKNSLFSWLGH